MIEHAVTGGMIQSEVIQYTADLHRISSKVNNYVGKLKFRANSLRGFEAESCARRDSVIFYLRGMESPQTALVG